MLNCAKYYNESNYASEAVEVTIPARPAMPAGWTTVNETVKGKDDGQITGLTAGAAYQYRIKGSTEWTNKTANEDGNITGLADGSYDIRSAAIANKQFASKTEKATISVGAERVCVVNVDEVGFDAVTYGYTEIPDAKAITITNDSNHPSNSNVDATIVNVTVNGSDFTVTDPGTTGDSVSTGATNTAWTVQPKTGLSAGDHEATITVTYKDSGDSEVKEKTATAEVKIVVHKAADSGFAFSESTLTKTYSDEAFTLSATGGSGTGAVTYESSDPTVIKIDGAEATILKVGTAEITATRAASTNYHAATAKLTVTVNKCNPTYTAPGAKTNLIYTGSALALVDVGSTNHGTIYYRLGESGEYSTEIPTATNAGTYMVYWKLTGDGNHTDIAERKIENITISKAAAQTANASATVLYSDTSEQSISIKDAIENYLLTSDSPIYGTPSVTSGSEKLSGTPSVDASGNLKFSLASSLTSETASATVTVEVTGLTDYEKVNVTVNISITPDTMVTMDMSGITLENKTYDGSALTYTGTVSGTTASGAYAGEIAYEWYDSEDHKLSDAPKNAGTYTLKAIATDTGYAGEGTKTITISPATLTVKALDKSASVGDSAPSLANPVENTDYTVTGLATGENLTTAPTLSYESTPDMNKAGTVAIKASGADAGSNYTIQYEDGKLTIAKRSYIVTISAGTGGTASASATTATEGTTITLTATTNSGYKFSGWTSSDVTITGASNETATFIMPEGNVTVTASWTKNSSSGGSSGGSTSGGSGTKWSVKSPATGDLSNPVLWAIVMLASAVGIAVSYTSMRRRRRRDDEAAAR